MTHEATEIGNGERDHVPGTTNSAPHAAPARSIAALGDEARGGRTPFGENALISCDQLVRIYSVDRVRVQALQGLDLLVEEGELTALVGASGSGKSTLLNILAGLDAPTAGVARVAGHDLGTMTSRQRLEYRRRTVGFVWQQATRNLLPYLTAEQNLEAPMRLAGVGRRERRRRATRLLELTGVGHCRNRLPDKMSGGEQQRVALGVALANQPRLLLADEPTGELDSATAAAVFDSIRAANDELGVTVLIVTHDSAVSSRVRRTVAIRNGRTSTETLRRGAAAGDGSPGGGEAAHHAVEYAVLDRSGRLQLPREMTEPLGMRNRVLLRLDTDHIGVWPDGHGAGGEGIGGEGIGGQGTGGQGTGGQDGSDR
jgi:ABC-type lipoprotein export system ATPase subunit